MTDATLPATPTTPPIQARDENRAIGLITVAHGFSHFYQILIPSLFVFISDALGLSYTQLGVLITLFFFASGVGQISSGFLVDRFGGRPLLLAGMALISGAHVAASFAGNIYALAAFAFLAGAGNSVFHPADFSLLNRIVRNARLPWAFSLHAIGGNIGYVMSPMFAIAVASAMSWRHALAIAGGIGLLLTFLIAFEPSIRRASSPRPAEKSAPTHPTDRWDLVRPLLNPTIFVAFSFFCVTTFYSTALSSFGPSIFHTYHGLEKSSATLLLSAYLIAQTIGIAFGGWLGARGHAPGDSASRATLFAALMTCALWFTGHSVISLGVVLCIIGACSGVVSPSRDLLVKRAAPKEALGRAYGVVYAGFDVGASIVPIVYGWLIDRRLAAVVIGFVVFAFLLNTFIARWLDRHTKGLM